MRTTVYWVLCLSLAGIAFGQVPLVRHSDHVPGAYVILLKDTPAADVDRVSNEIAAAHAVALEGTFRVAGGGFVCRASPASLTGLRHNPRIKLIEEDAYLYLSADYPEDRDTFLDPKTNAKLPNPFDHPLWFLDRIDQNSSFLNGRYKNPTLSDASEQPVTAYIIDTGVLRNHAEFLPDDTTVAPATNTAQVKFGPNFARGEANDTYAATRPCNADGGLTDPVYVGIGFHGTAVASALAGRKVGVARGISIVPIKVMTCQQEPRAAPLSAVIKAFDWIVHQDTAATCTETNGYSDDPTGPCRHNPYPIPNGIRRGPAVINFSMFQWLGATETNATCTGSQCTTLSLEEVLDDVIVNNKIPVVTSANNTYAFNYINVWNPISNQFEDIENPEWSHAQNPAEDVGQWKPGDACAMSPSRYSRSNPHTMVEGTSSNMQQRPWGRIGNVITVGALEADDRVSPTIVRRWGNLATAIPTPTDPSPPNTSNWGPCVSVWAPGAQMPLAHYTGRREYRMCTNTTPCPPNPLDMDGTSFASPVVAGMIARYLQRAFTDTYSPTADDVWLNLMNNSQSNLINGASLEPADLYANLQGDEYSSPNRLARLGGIPEIDPEGGQPSAEYSGGNAILDVVLKGDPPLGTTYLWYNAPRGVTQNQLTSCTTNACTVETAVRTSYWVRVETPTGTADSDEVTVEPTCHFRISPMLSRTSLNGTCTVHLDAHLTDAQVGGTYRWYVAEAGQVRELKTVVGGVRQSCGAACDITNTELGLGVKEVWVEYTATSLCGGNFSGSTPRMTVVVTDGNKGPSNACVDANGDGMAKQVVDSMWVMNFFFAGGPPPVFNSDANGDALFTVHDFVWVIDNLFGSGLEPQCPSCP